jgi:hypothetical protein
LRGVTLSLLEEGVRRGKKRVLRTHDAEVTHLGYGFKPGLPSVRMERVGG